MAKAKKIETEIKEEKVDNIDLTSVKEELTDCVKKEVKNTFNDEVKKVYNKLLRDKTRKIIFRDIVIVLLLFAIGYLVYSLNKLDYFDKYFVNDDNKVVDKVADKDSDLGNEEKKEEVTGPSLEDLKKEYSYLLLNIRINENSNYVSDFYSGNLSNELKNYLALNIIDTKDLVVDEDCNIIDKDVFQKAYSKIFTGDFSMTSFDFNGNKVKYIGKLESFITSSIIINQSSNIQREIIDIEVNDKDIVITTIEGIVNNNKLYNVITGEEIKEFKNDIITNYKDSLTKVSYKFKDNVLEKIN